MGTGTPPPKHPKQYYAYILMLRLVIALRLSLNTPALILLKGRIYKQFAFLDILVVTGNVPLNRIDDTVTYWVPPT